MAALVVVDHRRSNLGIRRILEQFTSDAYLGVRVGRVESIINFIQDILGKIGIPVMMLLQVLDVSSGFGSRLVGDAGGHGHGRLVYLLHGGS